MIVERFVEFAPGFIEGKLSDFEFLMGYFHVSSSVIVGAAGDKCNELFLALSLFCHVGVGEEWSGDFVSQHVNVELVNN